VAGKVALVTGAGTGIGRAVAVRLAEEGAEVVVTSRTAAHVEETCRLGGVADGRVLDVTDPGDVSRVVAEVVERYGRIDVLSNNAGIDVVRGPILEETTDAEWDGVLDVNVTGTFRLCRAALPHMPSGGSIVNMASINSFVAWPANAAYTASKGALLQLTRALALDAAPRGVRANCVCPGLVDTPLTDSFLAAAEDAAVLRAEYEAVAPLGRMADPREIAQCVLFLASDEASFVTGAALVADGGTLARV
jgi:NAD(P)-dependent dehydrogenase (short-subunit alcohol dehydrogenase family)